jgi:hypothetical protein
MCDLRKLQRKLGQVCDPHWTISRPNDQLLLSAQPIRNATTHSSDDPTAELRFAIQCLSIGHGIAYTAWPIMDEAKQPEPIESEPKESTASRVQRREAEIALAMKEEAARRAAVVKNMQRLRALRLSQTPKASASRAR